MEGEDARPLEIPVEPCPHCGAADFIYWVKPGTPEEVITCNGCGSVMSSTHPLDPDDRPMRKPPTPAEPLR